MSVAHAFARAQIEDRRAIGSENSPLISGRHETGGPVLGTGDGAAGFIEHHDVAWEIAIRGAKAVIDPRTQGRLSAQDRASVHLQHRRPVNRRIGNHAVNESDVIHALGQIRKEVGDPLAALPVLFEFPLGLDDTALILGPAAPLSLDLNRLSIHAEHCGFVIESVDVAGAAVHEKEDDTLGFTGEFQLGSSRGNAGGAEGLIRKKTVFGEHSAKGQMRKSTAEGGQKFPTAHVSTKVGRQGRVHGVGGLV